MEEYLREHAYRDAFKEFRQGFKDIVQARGGSVEKTKERFGNELLERLVFV